MKKIIVSLIILATLISCGDAENVQYDNVNGDTLLKFETTSAIPVSLQIGTSATASVVITSSTISDTDRTIGLSLDTDATTIPAAGVEFSNSVTIPAGEYETEAEVTIIDTGLDFTETYNVGIRLEGISNSTTLSNPSPVQDFSISITCPIPEDFMVGDYEISDVEAIIGPGNGTSNFPTGVVTLTADENRRLFSSGALPAFNSEIEDVVINLNCDVFQLGDVDPNLSCDGETAYIFSTTSRSASSTYSVEESDESFVISYIEDPNGSCGGPFVSSFRLTKVE